MTDPNTASITTQLSELRGIFAGLKAITRLARQKPDDDEIDWPGVEQLVERGALVLMDAEDTLKGGVR